MSRTDRAVVIIQEELGRLENEIKQLEPSVASLSKELAETKEALELAKARKNDLEYTLTLLPTEVQHGTPSTGN